MHSSRTTLKVSVKVVDALTGRIVQSFNDERSENATSLGRNGWSGTVAGGYSNSNFTSSSMATSSTTRPTPASGASSRAKSSR
ncbi:MAG TPA: hypothetical protein VMD91_04035 [Candidatus Sulfotelmatobacter sp.]|nr:hypothetical protein [Candidatus Sulfotelmatobacter sp.]